MSGSASVPNTFASQAGQVPASQLDANWTALINYINTREVDSGTLAARPTGSDGQWYFATDVQGGTLYFNASGFWVQAGLGLSSGVIVPVPVSQGGTGSTTWQAGAFLRGNGTQAFQAEGAPLNVNVGGTGAAGLTANAVLVGRGATTSVTLVGMGTSGTLLVGQASAPPVALTVGANSTILIADNTTSQGVRWGVGPKARLSFNQAGVQTAGQTLFWGPWASDATEATSFIQHILPFDCWVRNLYVRDNAAPGAGQDVKFTVRLNAVSTTLTATISGTADRAADSSTIIAAQAGDLLTVQVTFSSGAASSQGTGAMELTPR